MSADIEARQKPIQQMSDQEIVSLIRGKSLLNDVRQAFYHGMSQMEQAEAQRQKPSIIEQRKQEFLIAQRIIKIVEDDAADTIATLKAQLVEAREALRPWAELADQYRKAWEARSSQFKDEGFVLPEEKDTERVRLSVFLGQLRRAAEVLRKMEKPNG